MLAGVVLLALLAWGLVFRGIGCVIAHGRTATEDSAAKGAGVWIVALLLNYGFVVPIAIHLLPGHPSGGYMGP